MPRHKSSGVLGFFGLLGSQGVPGSQSALDRSDSFGRRHQFDPVAAKDANTPPDSELFPTYLAGGSLSLLASCPQCGASMRHGWQICHACGYCPSARERQALRQVWRRNLVVIAILALTWGVGVLACCMHLLASAVP